MFKDPKVLAGGALVLGAIFWFVLKPMLFPAPVPPPTYTDKQIAEAPRPTLTLEERVLNLKAPAASPNYVKTSIALEFADPEHKYIKLKGDQITAADLLYDADLKPELHRIWDVITSVVGGNTADQVATPEGREALKQQLITELNKEMKQKKVENIFFVSFVTQ